MGSKSDKGSNIGTSDTNVTTKIGAQGPLSETLESYNEFDVNKLKDPLSYQSKPMKGSGSKP